ncbi:polyprenol phosphomannose-dependent alpha 1,6 mannosyltransferase MptB [Angustibacter sp. McL0619]|uniref:polyprenol phosphomannose-dependent alpha 1,6 mannosyltransferase MptB n=1 Tax=Angustibacter sp. McL0619 TaxID=3415676 RepID=UPI003CF348D5
MTADARAAGRTLTPWALGAVAVSSLTMVLTAAFGPSAASPDLGSATGWQAALPPWSIGFHASSALVTGLVDGAYLLGAIGVALGLWAAYRGERLPPAALVAAGGVAVLAVLVAPLGSADHVSYAAYGRIAAGGGDPYAVPPQTWHGGHDPVTGAVEPPWTTTPSIYGPVATAVQALCSLVGGDSLRLTVWCWQLVCLAAWLAAGWLVLLLCRNAFGGPDGPQVQRAAWVWLLNPVLFGVLLVGAHVDLLGAALAIGALAVAGRRRVLGGPGWTGPLLAGVLLGASVGVKVTFALFGPALLFALWRRDRGQFWRPSLAGVLGAALVLVPAQLWAGAHTFDQLSRARRFVSLATPWRPFVEWVTGPVSNAVVRDAVVWLTPLVVLGLAVLLWLLVRPGERVVAEPAQVSVDAAGVAVVLGAAYVLGAPYSLPWYDAVVWAPLALVAVPALDALLLARLVAYAVAYVPGRVIGSSQRVQDLTLGYRRGWAPWIGLALWLALALLALRVPRPRGPARSPR